MHVSALSLTDFRSWTQLDLELAPGPTALVGSNCQAKTNILQDLLYVATLSPRRVATDAPVLRQEPERATVRSVAQPQARTSVLAL